MGLVSKVIKLWAFATVVFIFVISPPVRQSIQYHTHNLCPTSTECQSLLFWVGSYQWLSGVLQTIVVNRANPVAKNILMGNMRMFQWIYPMAANWGWEQGAGYGMFIPMVDNNMMAIVFSNKEYNKLVKHPKLTRNHNGLIRVNNLTTLQGDFVPLSVKQGLTVIQLNSDDPERALRRDLMSTLDTFASTLTHPETFQKTRWVPSDYKIERAIYDTIAINLFKRLFGVEFDEEHLELIAEYSKLTSPVVVGIGLPDRDTAKRVGELRGRLLSRVLKSEAAKAYMAKAVGKKLTAEQQIEELLIISLFAGYGGTGDMTLSTLLHIQTNPGKLTAEFRKDPDGFMLEAARHFTPVASCSQLLAVDPVTYTHLGGVTKHSVNKGDPIMPLITGANHDPTVFGGKDKSQTYADAWVVGRENADRIMTWNNELRDIRKCKNARPCPFAPRGCPGTHMALRLATQVVTFFVEGIEQDLTKSEL